MKARDGLRERWRNLNKEKRSPGNRKYGYCRGYPRHVWSDWEDGALEVAVLTHGTNWGEILDKSIEFQKMYSHMEGTVETHYCAFSNIELIAN